MAVSKILSVVLLGLFGAVLADPTTEASTTAGTGSTTPSYGAMSTAGGIQDCLTEVDKEKICELKPDISSTTTPAASTTPAGSTTPGSANPAATTPSGHPGICATAGAADDFCTKVATSVNGTGACCLAPNVCSFKVTNATGGSTVTSTAGTGPTSPETTTTITTTTAGSTTTAATGSTSLATGSTTAGPAIIPEPNSVYVSCHTVPAGFQEIEACPVGNVIFVYPVSAGSTTPMSTGSTTVDPHATTTIRS